MRDAHQTSAETPLGPSDLRRQAPGLPRAHIETLLRRLQPFDPAVVCLFGSRAQAHARPDSDLDVAFLPPHPCEVWAVFLASQELSSQLSMDVDLLDLRRASIGFRNIAVRNYQQIQLPILQKILEDRLGELEAFLESVIHGSA